MEAVAAAVGARGASEPRGAAARLLVLSASMREPGYFEPLCTARHLSVRFYDWEPSRYVGDFAHLAAVGLCLSCLLRESGTQGVSFKAHLLFLMVFSARFLNIFFCDQPIYLVIYKVLIWKGTLILVLLMCIRGSMQDQKDTLPLIALLLPTLAVTLVFGRYSLEDHGLFAEVLWIFSNYLEGIAMLPQYIYCYHDGENQHSLVLAYVLAMGGYQMVFGLHWILRLIFGEDYLDMSSLINGALGVVFFADYVVFKVRKRSPFSSWCMKVDKGLREGREALLEAARRVGKILTGAVDFEMPPPSPGTPPAEPLGKPSTAPEVELADASA